MTGLNMRYFLITALIITVAFSSCKKSSIEKDNLTDVEEQFEPVKVTIASNNILSQYTKHKEFIDNENSDSKQVIFTANVTAKGFWFIEIGHNEEPFNLLLESVLYYDTLFPDVPIVILMSEFSRIPQRGISYIDENLYRRYFYISEDGVQDGIYNLSEFNPFDINQNDVENHPIILAHRVNYLTTLYDGMETKDRATFEELKTLKNVTINKLSKSNQTIYEAESHWLNTGQ